MEAEGIALILPRPRTQIITPSTPRSRLVYAGFSECVGRVLLCYNSCIVLTWTGKQSFPNTVSFTQWDRDGDRFAKHLVCSWLVVAGARTHEPLRPARLKSLRFANYRGKF